MDSKFWLIVSVAAGILFLGSIFALIKRWRKGDVNYKNLYTVGISILPFGIIFISDTPVIGSIYLITSLVLIAVGLKHKDEWEEIVLTPKQKKRKEILLILVIFGLVVLFAYSLFAFYN